MRIKRFPAFMPLFLAAVLLAAPIGRGAAAPVPSTGQTDDYMTYSLPSDAIKTGPGGDQDPNIEYYSYCLPGSEPSLKTMIGREWYTNGKLTRRELYKNNGPYVPNKHGPQREWYTNGQMKSEEFYDNGWDNGISRFWDEQGNLVGQYTMVMGKGLKVVFDSKGTLATVSELNDNVENGFQFIRYADNGILYFSWDTDGGSGRLGSSFAFYGSGVLFELHSNGGENGPFLHFNGDGTLRNSRDAKQWNLHGHQVTEAQYADAAAKDSSLPPYFSDVTQYINYFVTPEIRAIEERYRNMPRVKIPLGFDANGNPILADGQPGADPAALMAPPPHYPPGYIRPAPAPAVATTPKPAAPKPAATPVPPIAQAESPSYTTPALLALGVLIVAGLFLRRRK